MRRLPDTGIWIRGLLPRLEELWREQGAPIASHLAPGASEETLAELEQRFEFAIPPELAMLWQWHDGVRRLVPDSHGGPEAAVIAGHWELLSSSEAFAERERRIQQFVPATYSADPEDWEGWWDPNWLPFARGDAYALFLDRRQLTPAGTAVVRHYDHTPMDPFTPVAGSLAALLGLWVETLERRYFWWSNEEPVGWSGVDWGTVPSFLKLTKAVG